MPYVDLAGLSRFAGKSKDFASSECAGLDMANWQRIAAAGAVSFSPMPEMPLDPAVNFLFSETGPASGTKAPDNPSTITGVSSVKVTRCGTNLVQYPYVNQSKTVSDVAFTVNDNGTVSANGVASADIVFVLYINIALKKGVSYRLSGCSGGSNLTYSLNIDLRKIYSGGGYFNTVVDIGSGATCTPTVDCWGAIYINIRSGVSLTNQIFQPQFELGSAATAFEPYEGADYTIDLGGTYYGGSVDLSTGVMTVTHFGVVFDGVNVRATDHPGTIGTNYRHGITLSTQNFPKASPTPSSTNQASTHFTYLNGLTGVFGTYVVSGNYIIIHDKDGLYPDSTSFNSWLASQYSAGTPVTFAYTVETPFTVQLTPQQIYSLSQIDSYNPRINTVYSDQVSVQVGYPKSPQASQNELTNAVVSLGGNL